MMFAFLKEDCPLFSRALIAPWRLCFLAAGLVLLCVGSHVTPSDDWDYPISFIMGVCAYVFAPWTVRALVYRRWKWLVAAFFFMWVSIDGVYSLYWWSRGFDALQIFRGANAIYCLPLYFALGFVMNVEVRRGEMVASTVGLVRSYFAWIQKHALHVVITGFLMFVFVWGILLATGIRKYGRLCDYPNKDALLAAEPDEVKKVVDFRQDGTNYTAVVLSWIGFLPSGPAVFIYNEEGIRVDHCSDSGDNDSFLRRWRCASW